MICRKKNGHLRMSLRGGGLLCLILCLVFSLFSFTLSASAISLSLDSYYIRYTRNWTSSDAEWADSRTRTGGVKTLSEVVNYNTGTFNTDNTHAISGWYPYGVSTYHFDTGSTVFTQNNVAFHAEINVVFSNMGYNHSFWDLHTPLSLNVVSCNRDIASQNVSYHITDWNASIPNSGGIGYFTNKTLTLYIDLALKNLTVGQQGSIFCAVDGGEAFARVMDSGASQQAYNTALFTEKFDTSLIFYASLNDALQTATNNALQQQTEILEWQRQHQLELEEKERLREQQLQGRSDSATTDGNTASSDANTASAPLLTALTTIYGFLLYPTATDCVIGPVSVYEMNLGNLDFCTGFNIPQPLVAIGGLLMIGLIILLAYTVLRTGLSLYNELLGGKK